MHQFEDITFGHFFKVQYPHVIYGCFYVNVLHFQSKDIGLSNQRTMDVTLLMNGQDSIKAELQHAIYKFFYSTALHFQSNDIGLSNQCKYFKNAMHSSKKQCKRPLTTDAEIISISS